jgi:competence protein ComEC
MMDFPLIRFTLFFIAGIILQKYLPINTALCIVLTAILFLILIVVYGFEKKRSVFALTSLILLVITLLAGYISAGIEKSSRNLLPDTLYAVRNFTAYGSIEKIDLPRENGFSFLFKTDSIRAVNTINTSVNLLCRVYGQGSSRLYNKLAPGNAVQVTGTFRKGRESCNPGEFDYNEYLHSANISGILSTYNVSDISVTSSQIKLFSNMTFAVRKMLNDIINSLHTDETSALLRGLLLADRSNIDYEAKTNFINAGVVHILAVSGLHVGYIALIFFVVSGRFNIYFRSFITVTGILMFMYLTGVPPSVFRASVMSIVVIIAFLSNRTTNIYNSLSISALLILALNPSELFDPGFQLSFTAVLSIAYFYPVLLRFINGSGLKNSKLKSLLLFASVSISAQIGTLPFILNYFGKLSIVAVFANLIVIPLAGIIIGTAIITLILYPVSFWIASVYASANNLFSDLLYRCVEFAGTLRYSYIEFSHYSSYDALVLSFFILFMIIFSGYMKNIKSKVIYILLILGNIVIISALDDFDILTDNKLNLYMIDVGQGDAFLIKFPDGETALIDAGEASRYFDNGERIIIPLLNRLGIDKIDYGFITHIDADHYGGFVSLIAAGRVRQIYKPPLDSSVEKDIRFERYLGRMDIPVEHYRNKKIDIGNAVLYILSLSGFGSGSPASSNNNSGMLKIAYGETTFLFTGDIDAKGEGYYIDKYHAFLNTDVLKISHHGSSTASSPDFMKITSPSISLISCGILNKFGHPSPEILLRLDEAGSTIYRTDKQGGILLQSDGLSINKIGWRNYY